MRVQDRNLPIFSSWHKQINIAVLTVAYPSALCWTHSHNMDMIYIYIHITKILFKGLRPVTRSCLCWQSAQGHQSGVVRYFPDAFNSRGNVVARHRFPRNWRRWHESLLPSTIDKTGPSEINSNWSASIKMWVLFVFLLFLFSFRRNCFTLRTSSSWCRPDDSDFKAECPRSQAWISHSVSGPRNHIMHWMWPF